MAHIVFFSSRHKSFFLTAHTLFPGSKSLFSSRHNFRFLDPNPVLPPSCHWRWEFGQTELATPVLDIASQPFLVWICFPRNSRKIDRHTSYFSTASSIICFDRRVQKVGPPPKLVHSNIESPVPFSSSCEVSAFMTILIMPGLARKKGQMTLRTSEKISPFDFQRYTCFCIVN